MSTTVQARRDAGQSTSPPRRRLSVATALLVLCVGAAAVLVWLLVRGAGAESGLDRAESREQVMSVTDQFVRRVGSYSPDMLDDSGQMPAYRDQVHEVITPKFAADFDKEVATAEQLVAQGGVARATEVFSTAVSSIDDDSARALVAGTFSDTYTQGTGKKARTVEQEPFPFRFVVDLVRIEGEWLVDDFSAAGAPEQGQPTPSPTGGPQ